MNKVSFLTTKEVAEKLRVTVRTVHKLIEEGELTAFRVGSQWRIPPEEVDAMLERNVSKGACNHAKS
jgi:excisionase family DNA binding protein